MMDDHSIVLHIIVIDRSHGSEKTSEDYYKECSP